MATTLTIISFSILVVYLISYFIVFRSIPSSLSDTYYYFETKWKKGWIFTVSLVIMGMILTPAFLELAEGSNLQFLAFLCPASILFVGAAPRFKDVGIESIIHPVAAGISALCGVLYILLVAKTWYVLIGWLLLIGIPVLLVKGWRKGIKECYTFWLEMIVFGAVYTTCITMLGK